MIPAPVQRALAHLVEEDLRGATVTSCSVNVDEDGRITLDEISLRRQDRIEVAIGLGGMRPESTRTTPAIVVEVFAAGTGWREMTVGEDLRKELEDLTRIWHPEPPEPWDRE